MTTKSWDGTHLPSTVLTDRPNRAGNGLRVFVKSVRRLSKLIDQRKCGRGDNSPPTSGGNRAVSARLWSDDPVLPRGQREDVCRIGDSVQCRTYPVGEMSRGKCGPQRVDVVEPELLDAVEARFTERVEPVTGMAVQVPPQPWELGDDRRVEIQREPAVPGQVQAGPPFHQNGQLHPARILRVQRRAGHYLVCLGIDDNRQPECRPVRLVEPGAL